MRLLNYILWDVDPSIFKLFGEREVRWYGLLWALSFIIGQQIMLWVYDKEGIDKKAAESLTVYMIVSTILGARLGHCFFYDWDVYSKDLIKIFYIWEGGLASHGAAVGIIVGMILYVRKFKPKSFFWLMDRIVIGAALAGAFIRFGNLMNSEIIGKPNEASYSFAFVKNTERSLYNVMPHVQDVSYQKTSSDTLVDGFKYPKAKLILDINGHHSIANQAVVTKMVQEQAFGILDRIEHSPNTEDHHIKLLGTRPTITVKKHKLDWEASFDVFLVPRHAGQLYESFSCVILFFILLAIYYKFKTKTPEGLIFGIFLIYVFGLRIVWETTKEVQVAFEKDMSMNMGQWLSIPFITLGLLILINSLLEKKWFKI